MREVLVELEAGAGGGDPAERLALLAYLAGAELALDEDELRAALRRAELLLAAGGDPHRRLEPDGRAVAAVAADLDSTAARAALAAGLERLLAEAKGLTAVEADARLLLADADLAWRSYACALLADDLAGDAS